MKTATALVPEDSGAPSEGGPFLHDFFRATLLHHADCPALDIPPGGGRSSRSTLSYRALDIEASTVAARLRPWVTGECIVAVFLPRTASVLYSAQLAVLRCGGAFTCLDPSFPDERLQQILEDSGAVCVITDRDGADRLSRAGVRRPPQIILGESVEDPEIGDGGAPSPVWLNGNSLAYVIYTSGTTGRPKGVMIEHRGITNLVQSDLKEFRLLPADRVAQGSSASYDSSVEETWLAWACGGTLVVMDDEASRLGPDLPGWLRREGITVFCPPPTLLRATGCEKPEAELPDLRLLYVGGEALPRDVADRWARGRRMVNGYGPTECTVTCLREEVHPGEEIRIGRPVEGMQAWTLGPDLEVLASGQEGELCIGGMGLARGYWGQPGLTESKFLVHPALGRIYRTGDLVRQDDSGRFIYLGRMDSQIKLRGYRIELEEIESHLMAVPGVRAAACRVQEESGRGILVAFVVPQDPENPPSVEELRGRLGRGLPSYMVPARIGFTSGFPRTAGGKLNRAALPPLCSPAAGSSPSVTPAPGSLEQVLLATVVETLGCSPDATVEDDFFDALGGDSLGAARLVTTLRLNPATAWVTVRDVYEARSMAALSLRAPGLNGSGGSVSSTPPQAQAPGGRMKPFRAGLWQTAFILSRLLAGSVGTYVLVFHLVPALDARLGLLATLLLIPPAVLLGLTLYVPVSIWQAVRVKRALIGDYREGRFPVWGGTYLRNWFVQQAVRLVPWWLIEGTEFQISALRALGARIGRRVHIHRGVDLTRGGWDLLEIGDDVTVGQDAVVGVCELSSGELVFAPVTLGDRSTIDIHAYVAGGARVEADGFLAARSSLGPGCRLVSGELWDGIPARRAGPTPVPPVVPGGSHDLPPMAAAWAMVMVRLLLTGTVTAGAQWITFAAAAGLGMRFDDPASFPSFAAMGPGDVGLFLMLVMLPVPLILCLEALSCRVMGRIDPGVISRWSPRYVRVWLKSGLVDSGSRWLYGTLFWPWWLRLSGMKVGRRCEISTLIDTVPELVEIGDRTFCADGIYLGGPAVHRGTVALARTRVGKECFLGNGAVVRCGTVVPDQVLLGVCTVADPGRIRPGTAWFGHPSFELPRREVVELDRRFTHDPSRTRYWVRVGWELARFVIPLPMAAIVLLWYAGVSHAAGSLSRVVLMLAAVPALHLAAVTAATLFVLAVKWSLIGRAKPGVHPLWSSWASRWDFVCLTWNLNAGHAVSALDGTPWLPWLLRVAGMRIGRNVVLGPGFASDLPDPDMIILEDGATVACLFQAHTFEDRVLKMDYVRVGQGATASTNAVILYGAEIGAGAMVAPNSVVMKREHLLPGVIYEGAPTRPLGCSPAAGGLG